jgi:hypothetical protein
VGDIFTLAGDSQTYAITAANTTVTATTNELFSIAPALATTYSSGDAATVAGDNVPNLVFHRDAFAFASRPLMDIDGLGSAMLSQVDPISGVALRLELSRQFKQTTFSFDSLWGSALIRAQLAAKILG